MLVVHAPLLFLNVQLPSEPSEKLTATGIIASLTMVAHPETVIANEASRTCVYRKIRTPFFSKAV